MMLRQLECDLIIWSAVVNGQAPFNESILFFFSGEESREIQAAKWAAGTFTKSIA